MEASVTGFNIRFLYANQTCKLQVPNHSPPRPRRRRRRPTIGCPLQMQNLKLLFLKWYFNRLIIC
jgi:hypothetical protein